MRVFLTGASGFVGSHVMRGLLNRAHVVTALVSPGNSLWRLQDMAGQFVVLPGRLNNLDLLKQVLKEFRPEACIHLAWHTEPGVYLHSPENISCLMDSLSLLGELIQASCQRVVIAGTCFEYDTSVGYLTEESAVRPATLYAASKLSCYLLCNQIAAAAKINFAWGRIFYPYGPKEDERRVVPAAIRALYQGQTFPATPGGQVRDYVFVDDVADAFCLLSEKGANGIFNISSGTPVTIHQLLETISSLMGCVDLIKFGAQPYRAWEPPFICGDNRRLKALGWLPRHTLKQGLSKTIGWWKTNASRKD